jgi:hypothetical protein
LKEATFAWNFQSPISLIGASQRLGKGWELHDSDYRMDSIYGAITNNAWARIYNDVGGFIVHLTVEAETEAELKVRVREARDKLLRETLPLLKASEIKESAPEAPNDYMSGWPRE